MSKKRRSILAGKLIAVLTVTLFLPVMLNAGDLNPPPGAPAPTMKTLDQIPPTWSQKINQGRFVETFAGTAVLDKETGLVWERYPITSTMTWNEANIRCIILNKGGRKGWHLPTVQQLASLIEPLNNNPALPNDHPFSMVFDRYWTSTAIYSPDIKWTVSLYDGNILNYSTIGWSFHVLCVRGGQTNDYAD